MPVTPYLRKLLEDRETLTRAEASALLTLILTGAVSDIEIAALLGALAARGETAAELAGFADATRAAATPFPLSDAERTTLTDTCGTGGDASGTFNISTAAALVAAAAGAKVAKHGNRAVSSRCGSADVLEALGVPIDLSPAAATESIRTYGFAYLHAPAMHSSVKAVAAARRALGVRTVFNVVGPLTNPAGAQSQVMGVYAADRVALVAETLLLLGTRHAFVVHGFTDASQTTGLTSGLDELSISGPSLIAELRDGNITRRTIAPEDFGLTRAPIAALRGGDAPANAAILRAIFAGNPGPCRDVTILNAAAVLVTAGRATDLSEGVRLAQETIDCGRVTRLLEAISPAT
jgi:anthranilate phosphoribosyltransferase